MSQSSTVTKKNPVHILTHKKINPVDTHTLYESSYTLAQNRMTPVYTLKHITFSHNII